MIAKDTGTWGTGRGRFAAAGKSFAVEGDRRKASDSASVQGPGTDYRTTRLRSSQGCGESFGVSGGWVEQPQAAELEMAGGRLDVQH